MLLLLLCCNLTWIDRRRRSRRRCIRDLQILLRERRSLIPACCLHLVSTPYLLPPLKMSPLLPPNLIFIPPTLQLFMQQKVPMARHPYPTLLRPTRFIRLIQHSVKIITHFEALAFEQLAHFRVGTYRVFCFHEGNEGVDGADVEGVGRFAQFVDGNGDEEVEDGVGGGNAFCGCVDLEGGAREEGFGLHAVVVEGGEGDVAVAEFDDWVVLDGVDVMCVV